jgi:hypothetical protein
MTAQELRKGEGDIIDDLFRADDASKRQVGTIVLKRLQVRQLDDQGRPRKDEHGELVYGPLELRVRALKQSELDRERRKCGRIWQIGEDGNRENIADPTELSARFVAAALVPEDRERYLEDKRMWDRFGVGGPIDVLDAWLTAGELTQAGAVVMRMSGIHLDQRTERMILEPSSEGADD